MLTGGLPWEAVLLRGGLTVGIYEGFHPPPATHIAKVKLFAETLIALEVVLGWTATMHTCATKNGVTCGSPHPAVHHTPPHSHTRASPAGARVEDDLLMVLYPIEHLALS